MPYVITRQIKNILVLVKFFLFKRLFKKNKAKIKSIKKVMIIKISLLLKFDLKIKTGKKLKKINKLSFKLIDFSSRFAYICY